MISSPDSADARSICIRLSFSGIQWLYFRLALEGMEISKIDVQQDAASGRASACLERVGPAIRRGLAYRERVRCCAPAGDDTSPQNGTRGIHWCPDANSLTARRLQFWRVHKDTQLFSTNSQRLHGSEAMPSRKHKTHHVGFRLTELEHTQLVVMAEGQGLSPGECCRAVLQESLRGKTIAIFEQTVLEELAALRSIV